MLNFKFLKALPNLSFRSVFMHVCTLELVADATHLSAAWNMPLAVCALRSGGHEERKISSSFIMERTFEADTRARERSKARLESCPRALHYIQTLHLSPARTDTRPGGQTRATV